MTDTDFGEEYGDAAPGEEAAGGSGIGKGVRGYLSGLVLAPFLTAGSCWAASTHLIYAPAVPVALVAFAIAQMGVHLVFFLHVTSGPDNVINTMALAFGVLIVFLVIAGSMWIMAHLNSTMMPMSEVMARMR